MALWMRRHRDAMGTVGLLLFLAFLFTAWFGVLGARPADAAPPASQPATPVKRPTYGGGVLSVTLQTNLPLTPTDWKPTIVVLINRDTNDETVAETAYTRVYKNDGQTTVELQVYLAENVVNSLSLNLVEAMVYAPSNVLQSVYLTFDPKPPDGGRGGGGGAGGAAPTEEGTRAAAGTVTVDPDSGTATYRVDPEAVQELVADPTVTTIRLELPADVEAENVTFELPPEAIAAINESGKAVEIVFAGVRLTIPAGALPGTEETLLLAVSQVSELATAPGGAYTAAGPVVELTLRTASGPVQFRNPVWLALTYDPARLGSVPSWKLGVYRLASDGTWTFVGGKVNDEARTVSARLTSFSRYTVLAYDRTFADMAGHWARMDVELMAAKHVVRGMTPTTYVPEGPVTRAQFAALLVRALGVPAAPGGAATFTDVGHDHWALAEVEAAAAAGLVTGVGGGRFEPDRNITREEMATMLQRAAAWAGDSLPTPPDVAGVLATYRDASAVAPWARQAVAAAVWSGLMLGRTGDQWAPLGTATRAEAAVVVKRLIVMLSWL